MNKKIYKIAKVWKSIHRQEGTVTAEFAVIMPAFLLLLSIIFFIGFLLTQQLQLNDNAHMASRALSRGEDITVVKNNIQQAFGDQAQLRVADSQVSVTTGVNTPLFSWFPLGLEAKAYYEPEGK